MREEVAFGAAPADDQEEITKFELSGEEQRLINNMRMMKDCAQEMLLDLSEQYRRTLPCRRVQLRLVSPN